MKKSIAIFVIAAGVLLQARTSRAKTISFETTEVTQPGVTVSPDGKSLVFNLLGHLFEMPVSGGAATQITFGPWYDSEPAFSPDGKRIAFVSSRHDGDDGNIFVRDLAGGKITQVSHEFQTGTPSWSPDGERIGFISYLRREDYPLSHIPGFGGPDTGWVTVASLPDGTVKHVTKPIPLGSVFFLPDSDVAWTSPEYVPGREASILGPPPTARTLVEAQGKNGLTVQLGAVAGAIGKIVVEPAGKSFYFFAGGQIKKYTLGDKGPVTVGTFADGGGMMGLGVRLTRSSGSALYAASEAKLWRVALPAARREPIVWSAQVTMEIADPLTKPWTPPADKPFHPTAILTPRISPDGKTLVFMAAGSLWQQPLSGGEAKKLVDDNSFDVEPAFSPDGKQLAYIADDKGTRELNVFDFATGQKNTLATVLGASWMLFPSWTCSGNGIVFQRTDAIHAPIHLERADLSGHLTEFTQTGGAWTARPQLSCDERTIYYTAREESFAAFYKLDLSPGAKPEKLATAARHIHDGLLSPDHKWFAYRRNTEIWIAPYEGFPLEESNFHRLSEVGGRSFSFTADSHFVIYSEGGKVWKQAVTSSEPIEIPIHLELEPAKVAPLLIRNARVIDVRTGAVSPGTSSLFIADGRIQWIGDADSQHIPADVNTIDAAGRYAMPGLTDSHMHTAWANQQTSTDAILAYGITTVRDTGSRIDLINALKDRARSTTQPVPRYFAAGDINEGLMPIWGDAFLEIGTTEEARHYVDEWKSLGADFIKLYASLPWYLKTAAAEEAHRQGMPTVGHGLSVEEITRSVNLGFATLEHDGPLNDDTLKLARYSGVKIDPTLTIGAGTGLMLSGPHPKGIDAKFRKYVPADTIVDTSPFGPLSPAMLASWQNTLHNIHTARALGVEMLDGTDALMTAIYFGPSLHWELQFFQDADISRAYILRMATLGAAETEGASADLGTLEPGKIGDVLLLDKNPLDDISNTQSIWRVVKGGTVFDPATMR